MSFIWVVILLARLGYWLYQRHSDRAYQRKWNETPVQPDTALPPRPVIGEQHLGGGRQGWVSD